MSETQYVVSFVQDDAMPDGKDWLIVEVGDEVHCIIRQSHLCPKVLEDAWAGYRQLERASRVRAA